MVFSDRQGSKAYSALHGHGPVAIPRLATRDVFARGSEISTRHAAVNLPSTIKIISSPSLFVYGLFI